MLGYWVSGLCGGFCSDFAHFPLEAASKVLVFSSSGWRGVSAHLQLIIINCKIKGTIVFISNLPVKN